MRHYDRSRASTRVPSALATGLAQDFCRPVRHLVGIDARSQARTKIGGVLQLRRLCAAKCRPCAWAARRCHRPCPCATWPLRQLSAANKMPRHVHLPRRTKWMKFLLRCKVNRSQLRSWIVMTMSLCYVGAEHGRILLSWTRCITRRQSLILASKGTRHMLHMCGQLMEGSWHHTALWMAHRE